MYGGDGREGVGDVCEGEDGCRILRVSGCRGGRCGRAPRSKKATAWDKPGTTTHKRGRKGSLLCKQAYVHFPPRAEALRQAGGGGGGNGLAETDDCTGKGRREKGGGEQVLKTLSPAGRRGGRRRWGQRAPAAARAGGLYVEYITGTAAGGRARRGASGAFFSKGGVPCRVFECALGRRGARSL